MRNFEKQLLMASILTLSALAACTTVPETQDDVKEAIEKTVDGGKRGETPEVETVICKQPLVGKPGPIINVSVPEDKIGIYECGINGEDNDLTPQEYAPNIIVPFKNGKGMIIEVAYLSPLDTTNGDITFMNVLVRDNQTWNTVSSNGRELQGKKPLKEEVILTRIACVDITIDRKTLEPEVKTDITSVHSFDSTLNTAVQSFACLDDGTLVVYPGDANKDDIGVPQSKPQKGDKKRSYLLTTFKNQQGIKVETTFDGSRTGKTALEDRHPKLYQIIEDHGEKVIGPDDNERPYFEKMKKVERYLEEQVAEGATNNSSSASITITGHEPERIYYPGDPNTEESVKYLEKGGMGLPKKEFSNIESSISAELFEGIFKELRNGNWKLADNIALDNTIANPYLNKDATLLALYDQYLLERGTKGSEYADAAEYFWEKIYAPINHKLLLQEHFDGTTIGSFYGVTSLNYDGTNALEDWIEITTFCGDEDTTSTLSRYQMDITSITKDHSMFPAVTVTNPETTNISCHDGMVILTQ